MRPRSAKCSRKKESTQEACMEGTGVDLAGAWDAGEAQELC